MVIKQINFNFTIVTTIKGNLTVINIVAIKALVIASSYIDLKNLISILFNFLNLLGYNSPFLFTFSKMDLNITANEKRLYTDTNYYEIIK